MCVSTEKVARAVAVLLKSRMYLVEISVRTQTLLAEVRGFPESLQGTLGRYLKCGHDLQHQLQNIIHYHSPIQQYIVLGHLQHH